MKTGEVEGGINQLALLKQGKLKEQLKVACAQTCTGRERESTGLAIKVAQLGTIQFVDRNAFVTQSAHRRLAYVLALCREMLGGAINCVDVVVTIVKEIAHFIPRAGLGACVFAAQGFVQRGEPFVRLPVGVMQRKKGACETGSIGGCEA